MGHATDCVVAAEVEAAVAGRRAAILDRPWTWLRQVHGNRVVVVSAPGASAGKEADAAVSDAPGAALCILTADCAPVALASPEGVLGATHAGWRGLAAGVLEATASAMRALGASDITAALGPCIRPGCYEFGAADLDTVAARLGEEVRACTLTGRPALDLPAAVRVGLDRAGVRLEHDVGACTACSPAWFSHRARGEPERQAMLVWRP